MSNYKGILTNKGKELLANATIGNRVNFSHLALGDGNGSVPTLNESRTSLVKERHRLALNSVDINPNNRNQIVCETIVPTNIGGFTVRELGLYVGNTLVMHSTYPPTYKPRQDEGGAREMVIRVVINVQNADVIALYLDTSLVYATREWAETNFVNHAEVVDSLTSTDTNKPLSAAQGKKLNDEKAPIIHRHNWSSIDQIPNLITNPTRITAGDLNTYINVGFYYCDSNTQAATITNAPVNRAFGLEVVRAAGVVQICREYQSSNVYVRSFYNNAWTPWKRLATTEDNAPTATKLHTARTISFSGAATGSYSFDGSKNTSCVLTLANSGVVSGTYGNNITIPTFTVNEKGLITGVSNHAIRSASTTVSGIVQLNDTLTSAANNQALTAAQGKVLNDTKLNNTGVSTLNGSLSIKNNEWRKIDMTGTDGMLWRVEMNPAYKAAANGVIGIRFLLLDGNNRQCEYDFPKSSGNEKVAYQSWVNQQTTLLDSKMVAKATGVNLDTQTDPCFFTNQGLTAKRLPIPTTNDFGGVVIGHGSDCTQLIAESGNLYVRGSDANPIAKETDWLDWKEILRNDTGVTLASNQTIGGLKTFSGTANFASGLKFSASSKSVWAALGMSAADVFIHNPISNKYLQLKDNGTLTYSGQEIYHEGRKPTWAEIDQVPNLITNATHIIEGDLNNYTTVGFYYCDNNIHAEVIANTPVNRAFGLQVVRAAGIVQIFYEYASSNVFVRSKSGSKSPWTAWKRLATTEDNAPTATKLQTARTINGVSFDGTANITITDDTKLPTNGNAVSATKLKTARTITITGDGTGQANFDGTANTNIALTLANSGVAVGSYNSVTVDAKGRVTAGLTQTYGLVTATNATGTSNTATTNTNTYLNIVASGVGKASSVGSSTRITGTNGISVSSDTAGKVIITRDSNSPTADKLKTASNIALTGAVTGNVNFDGSGNVSIATTLTKATVKDYNRTINATAAGQTTNSMDLVGQVVVGADGRITQYFHLKQFRDIWFAMEENAIGIQNQSFYGRLIPLTLWTTMPNKVLSVKAQLMRATSITHSPMYTSEAIEHEVAWAIRKQGNDKGTVWIDIGRTHGSMSEHIDLFVTVEGY